MLQLSRRDYAIAVFLGLFFEGQGTASVMCAAVADAGGLPLGGVSLNATSLSTGVVYSVRSEWNGRVCFADIPEGLYEVEAGLAGFLFVRYRPVRVTPEAAIALSFSLPFAEITEGGFTRDSLLSGTLLERGEPVRRAEICAVGKGDARRLCTRTNDLGEYALVVPAGSYGTTITTGDGRVYRSNMDLSVPGIFRNRLSLARPAGGP